MQDEDLLLIVGKRAERTTQIKFAGLIPVRWIKPRGILSEPGVSSLKFHFIQHSIAYAGEQIGFLVQGLAEAAVLYQLKKDLMNRILCPVPVAGYCGCEKEQSRAMLAI
jgi:hypothetical protein